MISRYERSEEPSPEKLAEFAAAMGYAWLLGERDGLNAIPARAGALNPQTAWVFKTVGLEPPRLVIDASPRFERIAMDLGDGKTLRIEAPGAGRGPVRYIQDVAFDGAPSTHAWLDWDQMRTGGTLRYALGDAPSTSGTASGDLPPAACAVQERLQ